MIQLIRVEVKTQNKCFVKLHRSQDPMSKELVSPSGIPFSPR